MDERRQLLVQRALEARRRAAEQQVHAVQDDDSSEESDESDSSQVPPRILQFVRKENRQTIIEKERTERELEEKKNREAIEAELFIEQQRQRTVEDAIREGNIHDISDDGLDVLKPPPIGNEDTEEAYQKWKIRELRRILKFRGLLEADEEEIDDQVIKSRDEMTEKERIQSATAKMKASLFKHSREVASGVVVTSDTPRSGGGPIVKSERAKIGEKFSKKSGGMRDL